MTDKKYEKDGMFADKPLKVREELYRIMRFLESSPRAGLSDLSRVLDIPISTASDRIQIIVSRYYMAAQFIAKEVYRPSNLPVKVECPKCGSMNVSVDIEAIKGDGKRVTGAHCHGCNEM